MNKNLIWFVIAAGIFLLVNSLTFESNTTEFDDHILSRLSKPVRLVDPIVLQTGVKPVDDCDQCLVPDPFSKTDGPICRWQEIVPNYTCRFGGWPVALLTNSRESSAQEVFMMMASEAIGPLKAIKIAKTAGKLAILFVLFQILLKLRLPLPLLVFFAAHPMFHSVDALAWTRTLLALLAYSGFLLVLSAKKSHFFWGVVAHLVQVYIWISSIFIAIPSIAIIAFYQKNIQGALWLGGISAAFLGLRIAANFLPDHSNGSDFMVNMVEVPVWSKSWEQVTIYLTDVYGVLSLSANWVDFVSPMLRVSTLPLSILYLQFALGFGASVLVAIWAPRRLIGLFLVTSFMFFILGHNTMPTYLPRFIVLFPLAFTAAYLSAQACGDWIRKMGWSKLSQTPLLWIWILLLLNSSSWIYSFQQTGPPMAMNADFGTNLSEYLLKRNITSPIIVEDTSGLGMFDLLSKERIRPLYLNFSSLSPALPSGNPMEDFLWPWTRVQKGVLLQRNSPFMFEDRRLDLEDLKVFAKKHNIELGKVDFYPYRGTEGYWIVDFVNNGFKNK